MGDAIRFLTDGDVVVFGAALVAMLAIGVVQAVGLGEFDVDGDADTGAAGPLDWLGVGRVPLLILLTIALFAFGLVGIVGQQVAITVAGAPLTALVAVPAALAAALPATGLLARLVARILPRDESSAVTITDLVGRIGHVVTGTATPGSPARTRVLDRHGHPHFVMAEPADPEQRFAEGDAVYLSEIDGHVFRAVAWDNPLLPSSLER